MLLDDRTNCLISFLLVEHCGFTHKLLCFIRIGRLSKAAVSSANARRALNRRMKNITPPRVKTPELVDISWERHKSQIRNEPCTGEIVEQASYNESLENNDAPFPSQRRSISEHDEELPMREDHDLLPK